MSPDTLLAAPPLFAGPVFALFFFWVATALGFRLMRWLRVPTLTFSPWEHGFVAAALGTGSLQLLPCALAVFGWMTVTPVRIASVALVLLLSLDMAHVARGALRELRALSALRVPRPIQVWLGLLALVLGSLLMRALVFRNFGDDDGYHLSSPKRWLSSGTLHYLPSYTHTNASLGFEMLYVIALSTTDVIGAKMLHYGAGLFTLLGVLLCSRRLGNVFAGVATISLFLIHTPFSNMPLLFTVAYADFGACWMAIACALLWLVWRADRQPRILVCFALCAGFAGSFKFTSLALGLAWAPALLYDSRKSGASLRQALALAARFGAISVIPVLPWLTRNLLLTGNPLYPVLAGLIPTRDWPAERARIFGRYVRYYSWGIADGAHLGEAARRHILMATVLSIVLIGAVSALALRKPVLRALLGFAATFSVISVALTGMIFRYWTPGLLCASLALLVGLTDGWRPIWRYWLASTALALALIQTIHMERGDVLSKDTKVALGLSTFAQEHPKDKAWAMWRFINSSTPGDAKVLAAAFYTTYGASSYGGFWSDRPFYTTDSHLQSFIPLDDWSSFVARLRSERITHVLIFEHQSTATRDGFSFKAQTNEYPFCRRLVEQYGDKVAQFGDLQLYRVRFSEAVAVEREPGPDGGVNRREVTGGRNSNLRATAEDP